MDPKLLKLLGIVAAITPVACAGGKAEASRPHATFAESFYAQDDFQQLESRWSTATPEERRELEPLLTHFLERYPADPKARIVSLYLAWVSLERNEIDRAERLVSSATRGDRGTAADFARVMRAALLLRRGKADLALAELESLRDKVIDPTERFICNDLLIQAGLAAGAIDKAPSYMLHFLIQAPAAQRDVAKEKLRTWFEQTPTATLERWLNLASRDDEAASSEDREQARAVNWMLLTLRQYLTTSALEAKDTELAQRLLQSFVPEGASDALSDLASAGQLPSRISGRSLGLVLELETPLERRRSSEVALGMIEALGLLRPEQSEETTRLKVRPVAEGRFGTRTALQQLTSDGVGLIVAGVSDTGVNVANDFAETEHVPVLLLRSLPTSTRASAMTFVLGEDDAAVEQALLGAAQRQGLIAPTRIDEADTGCAPAAAPFAGNAFPLATWRANRVEALLLLAQESCGLTLIEALTRARFQPLLLLGLDTAHLYARYPRAVTVKSGLFPDEIAQAGSNDATPVSWYRALGHDAALLASAALASFPPSETTDSQQIQALEQRARRQLSAARVQGLWTTSANGFIQGARIERQLTTLDHK